MPGAALNPMIDRYKLEGNTPAIKQSAEKHLLFNAQPVLSGDTLELRPFDLDDLEALYLAASAREIWEGHPANDRHLREVFEPYAGFLLSSGTTLVVLDRQTNEIIGCSRYYVSPDQPDSISIGFTFIHHSYWGGTTNFELKRLMLDHAFQSFKEVWFHIAPSNVRSQKATAKLGAENLGAAVLDLSGSPMMWMCFRLTKQTWKQISQTR